MSQHLAPESGGGAVEGRLLWEPSDAQRANANITRYVRWLKETRGRDFATYDELWAWSVEDLEGFWSSIWDFFGVAASTPPARALGKHTLPGAEWFPGARLNFAEHALRRRDDHTAIVFKAEDQPLVSMTYRELADHVARAAAGLRKLGVRPGDRVVGFLPNIPETVIAFLATASLGAIWSCCSPEFGVPSVVDRFRQIEPRVLIAADGYRYGGRGFDRRDAVAELERALPTLETTVIVPRLETDSSPASDAFAGVGARASMQWADLVVESGELTFEQVPFDHPLWVLYSSGTTGLPKAIVHGHGGILHEHYKALALHLDLTEADRFFWFTTSGWMMWNMLVCGLLVGSTIVLYDGSPAYPDLNALWQLAEEAGITYFGASAPYIQGCRKAGIQPGRAFDLSTLKGIGSTGAPLSPEGFEWVYDTVKRDLLLGSVSGGTDVCTAFILSCPILPVHSGELQCRGLGAKIEAFNPQGEPVIGQVGELVVTEPLPSMPVALWNDPEGIRYRESYLDVFPGIWRHGDWIKVTERGSCVIYGRSDSTLNRGGVRMGTSELYSVVEELPEVADSLVVDTSELGVEGKLLLFVVPADGITLDDDLRRRITRALARDLSPRHVPDAIYAIPAVPRTLNGKKMEVPVKRILAGAPVERVMSRDAMSNPDSLIFFIDLAAQRS
jgi:acetoacetyl-CoA synthetase